MMEQILKTPIQVLPLFILLLALLGCSPTNPKTPHNAPIPPKALFERTTKTFHVPSTERRGPTKKHSRARRLQVTNSCLKTYPDQDIGPRNPSAIWWNIRATQGKLDEAVNHYANVEKKYPQQRWEVLMSSKSAADLLWEAGRRTEAKPFYQKIVAQYDRPESPQVEKTIVRGSKLRLTGSDLPAEN